MNRKSSSYRKKQSMLITKDACDKAEADRQNHEVFDRVKRMQEWTRKGVLRGKR